MRNYNRSIVNKFDDDFDGNAGSGIPVTVRISNSGIKAELFDKLGGQIDNPVNADDNGNYSFYINNGFYDIIINEGKPNAVTVLDEPIFTGGGSNVIADLVSDYGAAGDAVYEYAVDGSVNILSGTDDTQPLLDAMADFASGSIGVLTVPDGNFWIDSSQIDTPTGTTIIGSGSASTKLIMSTTAPNTNLFVGFYEGARVRDLSFTGLGFVGSKVDDNLVGGTCIFTLGTTNVYGNDLSCEGSKGLAWFGEDVADLHGTQNVFFNNLSVTDCKLFSVYMRGVENPPVEFDTVNETSNININGLTIRGSNVGFVCAEGRPRNLKLTNYDCQFTDNLLQIEASDDIKISNFHISNATSKWNQLSPAPFKQQWQISGSSDVSFVNGYIDAELQSFVFGTSDVGNDNVSFTNITTGDFFRCTTLNVQSGADVSKGLFFNWNWTNCSFSRSAATFFQSDVGDQSSPEIAYWRDWGFSNCSWVNDSTNTPFVTVAVMGSLVFDDKCTFAGKPPRALKGTNITFDATVRANGIIGSDIQFTAVDGLEVTEPKILRLSPNVQIEGEVRDVGFDYVNDNGSYDSRNTSEWCRATDAGELKDSGMTFRGFTGTDPIKADGVVSYSKLAKTALPSTAGENTFIEAYNGNGSSRIVDIGHDLTLNDALVIIKIANFVGDHFWFDTLRGVNNSLISNGPSGDTTTINRLVQYTTEGYNLGSGDNVNGSGVGQHYKAYAFTAAPGFLDVILEDSGTGSPRAIPHNLLSDVGCIMAKSELALPWAIYWKDFELDDYVTFDSNGVVTDATVWDNKKASSTEFYVGSSDLTNRTWTYTSFYVFADSVCHSYSGSGVAGNEVNFGYKPKVVIIKRVTAGTTGNFSLFDNIENRSSNWTRRLIMNDNSQESTLSSAFEVTDDGITLNTSDPDVNAAGSSYMLIAIPEV